MLGIVAIVAITIVVMVGIVLLKDHDQQNGTTSSDDTSTNKTSYITYDGKKYQYDYNLKNILFIGVDKKENFSTQTPGEAGQSDALILMTMNQKDHSTSLLEISRDSMTDIKIYNVDGEYVGMEHAQITLQYGYGDGKKKSCTLTKDAVSKLLYDIPISSYIALTIEGMIKMTDAMGGVEMTIPKDYRDLNPAFVEGATILMNGEMVEDYVRSRDTEVTGSNNDRMERQTHFLESLAQQLQGREVTWYASLFKQIEDYIVTDLSLKELEKLSSYTMNDPIEIVPGHTIEGEEHDEFIVDTEKLQELIIKRFYKEKE